MGFERSHLSTLTRIAAISTGKPRGGSCLITEPVCTEVSKMFRHEFAIKTGC